MALYQKTKRFIVLLISLILINLLFYYSYNLFTGLAYPIKYKESVIKAANEHGIDKYLILAIIREESRFNSTSVSHKGAVGLMQLMPKTAGWISNQRKTSFNKNKLYAPQYNIDSGSWYFSYLRKRYGSDELALAAYNGGTVLVDKLIAGPRKNISKSYYPETRNFIIKVSESRKMYKKLYPDF